MTWQHTDIRNVTHDIGNIHNARNTLKCEGLWDVEDIVRLYHNDKFSVVSFREVSPNYWTYDITFNLSE